MHSTKHLSKWADLESYGIKALTMESCGCNMRMLCDLTRQGMLVIQDLFGFKHNADLRQCLGENWNSRGECSIMLPTGMLSELLAFVLLREGWPCVIAFPGTVMAVDMEMWKKEMEDPDLTKWDLNVKCMGAPLRQWTQIGTSQGTAMRNQHQMSGRVS